MYFYGIDLEFFCVGFWCDYYWKCWFKLNCVYCYSRGLWIYWLYDWWVYDEFVILWGVENRGLFVIWVVLFLLVFFVVEFEWVFWRFGICWWCCEWWSFFFGNWGVIWVFVFDFWIVLWRSWCLSGIVVVNWLFIYCGGVGDCLGDVCGVFWWCYDVL